jgi:LPXTG-motif cell wall-anchored protein
MSRLGGRERRTLRSRPSRLLGPITLYALVATLALAAPIAISEEPVQPAADTTTTTTAAPAPDPAAQPAPTTTTTEAAPAPAPAPAAPAADATTTASADPVIADTAPAEKAKPKKKVIAIAAASTGVTISDFKFAPGNVTVNVGDTVTWSNNGPTGHSATASNGSFDTGILAKGSSGSHTFDQAGTFSYFCKPHPFMKGTITVVASAAQNGSDNSSNGSSGTSGSSGTAPQDSGPALPSTGFDVGGIAVLGLATLALGAYLRRRTELEPARPAGRIGW